MEFVAASTVAEAIAALAANGKIIAGGTDLMVQMRTGRLSPKRVVDIKRIAELIGVSQKAGAFVIGAATPGAQLGEDEALIKAWPGLVEAANLIGSTQVQGRASLGGNLCNASPAADSVPALIAAGAICVIEGPKGRREAPVETIQKSPGQTTLAPGELIVSFRLPKRGARASDAYLRLIPRTEMDIAVVGVGVSMECDANGVVTAARVSVGAVAPTTLLVGAAGEALVGSKLGDAALDKAAAAARAACKPISDKRGTAEYRTKVAGVLTRRAAKIAYERALA